MDNLSQAIRQVLEEKGVLSELKAKIRAEIFESLQIGKELGVANIDTTNNEKENKNSTKLLWNKKELIIHELIKEYMTFHGLQHSLSVFLSETKQNNKTNKICVESELEIETLKDDDDDYHPVIYDIVQTKQDFVDDTK